MENLPRQFWGDVPLVMDAIEANGFAITGLPDTYVYNYSWVLITIVCLILKFVYPDYPFTSNTHHLYYQNLLQRIVHHIIKTGLPWLPIYLTCIAYNNIIPKYYLKL